MIDFQFEMQTLFFISFYILNFFNALYCIFSKNSLPFLSIKTLTEQSIIFKSMADIDCQRQGSSQKINKINNQYSVQLPFFQRFDLLYQQNKSSQSQASSTMQKKTQFLLILTICMVVSSDCNTVRKIINFPNTQLIQPAKQNDIIKFEWVDPAVSTSFGFLLYSTTQTLSDLSNNSKAALTANQLSNSTTLSIKVLANRSYNLIRVYANETSIKRYRITHSQVAIGYSYIQYGMYVPPSYQKIIIPLPTINTQPCQYYLERNAYSSFATFSNNITIELIKPGVDPLVGTAFYKFVLNPLSGFLVPQLASPAGTWHLRFTTSLLAYLKPASTITIQSFWIKMNSYGCVNCNNKCYNSSYVVGSASNYLIVDDCFCPDGYLYNSKDNLCYRNCASVAGVNSSKLFNTEPNRCECTSMASTFNYATSSCSSLCIDAKNNAVPSTNTTKSVSSDCPCLSNYFWSSDERVCLINCSLIANTVNPTSRFSSEACYCKPKYSWDFRNKKCSLNCSSIQYADCFNIYYLQPGTQCPCIPGSTWNATTEECKSNCAAGFVIDLTLRQCVRACSSDPNAVGLLLTNYSRCICKTNFIWNTVANKCVRNCAIDIYATTFNSANVSICICANSFIWNTPKSKCVRNCSSDSKAVDFDPIYINTCTCVSGFIWNGTLSKCVRNCGLDALSTIFLDPNDTTKCTCMSLYTWNSVNQKCVRICSVDPYAIDFDPSNVSRCSCKVNFIWNVAATRCVRNCPVDAFAITYQPRDVNRCLCQPGFGWNLQVQVCIRNCCQDPYAQTLNVTDYRSCNCKVGYTWDAQLGKCTIDCTGSNPQCVTDCRLRDQFQNNIDFCENKCRGWEIWNGYSCAAVCSINQIVSLNFQVAGQLSWKCITSTASLNSYSLLRCQIKPYYEQVNCYMSCPMSYDYPRYYGASNNATNTTNSTGSYYTNSTYSPTYTNSTNSTGGPTSGYENCQVLHSFYDSPSNQSYLKIQIFSYTWSQFSIIKYEDFLVCPKGYALQSIWKDNIYMEYSCQQLPVASTCRPGQVLDSRNTQQPCLSLCQSGETVRYLSNYYGVICIPALSRLGSANSASTEQEENGEQSSSGGSIALAIICTAVVILVAAAVSILIAYQKMGMRISFKSKHENPINESCKELDVKKIEE